MAPRFDPQKDLVDLKGKVVIVTGANRQSGLGYGTVRHLARAGAKNSVSELKMESEEYVLFLKLDLGDPRSVKKVAEEFMSKETRLDVLVNNAAMVFAPFEKTEDGISKIVVTNLISPFVFTQTLLPLMAKTAQEENSDVRIVNLTSSGHLIVPSTKKLDTVNDLNQEFRGWGPIAKFTRYIHTKLLIILWSRALQKHLNTSPSTQHITAITLDPGSVDTFSKYSQLSWLWQPLLRLIMSAPDLEHGTYPMAFAAAGKAIGKDREKYAGAYVNEKCELGTSSKDGMNEKLAGELWELVEKIVTDMGI
ncbi:NAD(P)-binding protein [Gymnopus androsaceus JB14]|uniref:NAD(P)-binding protein n=1 Tax=Gymnopus androsaceus JB14 TaxID=1447944 RepID=A0A6A4HGV5_9AGAR|nr:NAD(P)-binding protein [Gymnopus androsaceus JB14]